MAKIGLTKNHYAHYLVSKLSNLPSLQIHDGE